MRIASAGFAVILMRMTGIAIIFALAGFIKGLLGLGLPTVAMGLLAMSMPPAQAAGLLLVPSLATNLAQGFGGRAMLGRLAPFLLCSGGATLACVPLMTEAIGAQMWMGAALLAYGLSGLMQVRIAVPPRGTLGGAALRACDGVVTGATGVFVLPAVPYLVGLGLDRDRLVQAMGLSFTTSTLALGAGLWSQGALTGLGASTLALIPTLAGMAAGAGLRRAMGAARFRLLFFLALVLLGLHGIWAGYSP